MAADAAATPVAVAVFLFSVRKGTRRWQLELVKGINQNRRKLTQCIQIQIPNQHV